jgi:hypothetical protein
LALLALAGKDLEGSDTEISCKIADRRWQTEHPDASDRADAKDDEKDPLS